jgi:hypothetical protein
VPKASISRVWAYDEACRVAGELYGNIFGRDSDEIGYKFTINQLTSGYESLQEIVRRFCTSDEFREKYVMNQTPNELARRLLLRFSRRKRATPETIKALAVDLLERDWRVVIEQMINDDDYLEIYGTDRIPIWARP